MHLYGSSNNAISTTYVTAVQPYEALQGADTIHKTPEISYISYTNTTQFRSWVSMPYMCTDGSQDSIPTKQELSSGVQTLC